MQRIANKKGVPLYKFSVWFIRKYKEIIIERQRYDGLPGISLPCVLCRKTLDKFDIPWKCQMGEAGWVCSKDDFVPPSRPTTKQKMHLFRRKERR